MVKCLSYVSESLIEVNDQLVQEFSDTFASQNFDFGINGFLIYSNSRFFQYIEGEAHRVDQLMKNIKADDRHEVKLEMHQFREGRRVDNWSMKYLKPSQLTEILKEDGLIDLMVMAAANPDMVVGWEKHCWRMVDEISQKHHDRDPLL